MRRGARESRIPEWEGERERERERERGRADKGQIERSSERSETRDEVEGVVGEQRAASVVRCGTMTVQLSTSGG